MCEADGGWAAHFSSFCSALGFSRFDGESTLLLTAANASRWAKECAQQKQGESLWEKN